MEEFGDVIRPHGKRGMAKRKMIVCIGRAPVAGCGTTLTIIEQRRYDGACEYCEMTWQERWRSWSLGSSDVEFDELFGPEKRRQRRA